MTTTFVDALHHANRLDLEVTRVRDIGATVREVTMARPDRGLLPGFPPGSSIGVRWAPNRFNSYSLTSDGSSPSQYTISVRRRDDGRGGSLWVHDLGPGDPVQITSPRNEFPSLLTARRHLLIAGGIGVTPMLSHVRHLARMGADFELHYVAPIGHAAHLDEVRELAPAGVTHYPARLGFAANLELLLRRQPIGTHLYVCGPPSMIDEVHERARMAGWPAGRLHSESFVTPSSENDTEFVAVARGRRIAVPVGTTLLEALEDAGISVPSLCRRGVCGECRTGVISGLPDHRDHVLDEQERASGTVIMPCVSRSGSPELAVQV